MKLVSFLVGVTICSVAHALQIIGNFSPAVPYSNNDDINIIGDLVLSAPGTYSAKTWHVVGEVRMLTPGAYTLVATQGGITFIGGLRGPSSGAVTLTVNYATSVSSVSGLGSNVTLIDGTKQTPTPPPTTTPTTPPTTPPVTPPTNPPATVVVESAILANMSVRGTLLSGQTLTPGFVVSGSLSRRILVRAIGPSLAAFGVSNPLSTPILAVFSGTSQIAGNAGWGGTSALASVFMAVGAFALPTTSRDAAMVLTLNPGSYTVSVGGGAGEVLVEVYFVD